MGLVCRRYENPPSHKTLEDAITSLERMMMLGAVAADGKTGDGSRFIIINARFFYEKIATQKVLIYQEIYAVAMIFTRDLAELIHLKNTENK